MICPKCKVEIDADSFYCDQCGQEIRYCQACRRPGKGNRCTACGGRMLPASGFSGRGSSAAPVSPAMSSPAMGTSSSSEASSSRMALDVTVKVPASAPRVIFSNSLLGITFEGSDGAVIGRKQGIYSSIFASYPYVSGAHARLKFDSVQNQWMIVDMNSSNGTKYNGKALGAGVPCVLHHGATIQLANILLTVSISS